jgi:hypothetical protein
LAYVLDQKLLKTKLSFWLPLRSYVKNPIENSMVRSLVRKIDFGKQIFQRDQFESQLVAKIDNVELRKHKHENEMKPSVEVEEEEVSYYDEEVDDEESKEGGRGRLPTESEEFLDPVLMMEQNLGNISAISTHIFGTNANHFEDTLLQDDMF